MLINCPRCGFQQPQDKYCAQCGVDMESYKPAAPPLWKRFISNTFVQLFLLIAAVLVVGGTLYKQGQKPLATKTYSQRSQLQVSSSESLSESASESTSESTEAAPPTLDTDATDGTITAYKVTAPESSAEASPTKSLKPQIIVYYTEINQENLNSLFGASRNTGQFMDFGDYSAGLLPQISKILGGSQIKILHKETRSLESMKSLEWFYGIKNLKEGIPEQGLTTSLTINDIENKTLRGTIDIQRSWPEPQNSGAFEMQKRSFPAEFEIDEESGFFISGLMPRRSYLDNDRELTNIDIYKILSSAQFRSGESNFVIFIDFENGN